MDVILGDTPKYVSKEFFRAILKSIALSNPKHVMKAFTKAYLVIDGKYIRIPKKQVKVETYQDKVKICVEIPEVLRGETNGSKIEVLLINKVKPACGFMANPDMEIDRICTSFRVSLT